MLLLNCVVFASWRVDAQSRHAIENIDFSRFLGSLWNTVLFCALQVRVKGTFRLTEPLNTVFCFETPCSKSLAY